MTPHLAQRLISSLCLLAACVTAQGCNALGLGLTTLLNADLAAITAAGAIGNAPPKVRVGYLAWIETARDSAISGGRIKFDLIQDRTITFDKTAENQAGQYRLTVTPAARTAEGTYVILAWDDVNGNGIYESEQNERRAPEVYRLRGQAGVGNLWSAEKLIFTDQRLSIGYADLQKRELNFNF